MYILFAVLAPVSSQTLAQPGPATSSDVLLGGGTGFLIASSGLVVTNHHVIAKGHRQEIYLPHVRRSFPSEVVVSDQANDLTILRVLGADAELAK